MQNNWLGIRLKNNQRGSAAIEFIGMVPLLLARRLIIWQFFVAGFAVYSAQTAANGSREEWRYRVPGYRKTWVW